MRNLLQNGGVWAVSDIRRHLHTTIDRPRRENEEVRFGPTQSFAVHAEEPSVFPDRGKQAAALALELDPQEIHDIAPRQNGIEVMGHFDSEVLQLAWHESGWSANNDSRS